MIISVFAILWLFWFSWFLHYGFEVSTLVWVVLLCWWSCHIDLSYTSTMFLLLTIFTLLFSTSYSSSWLHWSEFNYMLAIFLMFMLTTSSFWVHDTILLVMVIDMLHLILALLIMSDSTLSRVLMFLMSGWIFNILIILSISYNLCYLGDADLYRMLLSHTSSLSGCNDLLYLLILGKLYVIPWTLVLVLIYSSIRVDVLLLVTMLFTVHFTFMLISVLVDVMNPASLWYIIVLVSASLLLTALLFLDVSDLNVFLGLSFSVIVHLGILMSLLTGTHVEDINVLLISVYTTLTIVFMSSMLSMDSNSLLFDIFDGLSLVNWATGGVLVIVILMFLGIPPSIVFILKTDFLHSIWLYASYIYGLILCITVMIGTVYMRLAFRVCMSSTSSSDIIHLSSTSAAIMSIAAVLSLFFIFCIL